LQRAKEQGEEDQALEKRAEQKKAQAKKKATRRSKLMIICSLAQLTIFFAATRAR